MKSIIVILIVITLGTGTLTAQTATPPASGDGSSGDPYQIATLNNLFWITQNSGEWNKYYEQTADIDASSSSGWHSNAGFSPIGNSSINFTGSYDGQYHTISGITINRSAVDFIGMFGYTYNSTIKNLGVTDVGISGDEFVGGLAGYHKNSNMTDCYSTGNVTGGSNTAGLVGHNYESSSVDNCYSTCTLTLKTGTFWYTGGLVGRNYASCTVSNCYSTGTVTGDYDVGGLVGRSSLSSTINNCYSTGSASGISTVGGLVGYNSSTVSNSFWDTETSENSTSSGGTGKTTAEMKDLATFTDVTTVGLTTAWDFETNPNDDSGNDDFWDMDLSGTINSGYPFLYWENEDDVSLPVELASFSACQEGRSVVLEWITESEKENLGFIIERKTDNTMWYQIASYQIHTALQGRGIHPPVQNIYSLIRMLNQETVIIIAYRM